MLLVIYVNSLSLDTTDQRLFNFAMPYMVPMSMLYTAVLQIGRENAHQYSAKSNIFVQSDIN